MLLGIRDSLLMLPCVRQRSGELPALLALVPEELLWRDPAWDPSKRKCWKSGRRRGTCSGKRVRVRSWIHSIGDSGCFGLLPVYPTSAEQAQLMDYCWSSMRRGFFTHPTTMISFISVFSDFLTCFIAHDAPQVISLYQP
ncbi:hypothetical protein GOODEAATRI_025625 [Goodea atripinnis]|uniref:Uncharacterized protein n=1 Tax=Goodea atripinnis TaxID=208336 RepID=A0ABV0NDM0_9TELE